MLSPRSVLSDDVEMHRAVPIGTEDLRMTVGAGDNTTSTETNGGSQDDMEIWSGVLSVPVPLAATSRDSETSSMRPPSPSYHHHHRNHLRDYRDTPPSPLLHVSNHNNNDSSSLPPPPNDSPLLIRLNSVSTTSTRSNTGTEEQEPSLANSTRSMTTAGGTGQGYSNSHHGGGVIDLRKDPRYRYQLIQKIGEGGYGSVYKAFDNHTSGTVAIKLIDLEGVGDELEEVNQEIAVMSNVHCPQVQHTHGHTPSVSLPSPPFYLSPLSLSTPSSYVMSNVHCPQLIKYHASHVVDAHTHTLSPLLSPPIPLPLTLSLTLTPLSVDQVPRQPRGGRAPVDRDGVPRGRLSGRGGQRDRATL